MKCGLRRILRRAVLSCLKQDSELVGKTTHVAYDFEGAMLYTTPQYSVAIHQFSSSHVTWFRSEMPLNIFCCFQANIILVEHL